LSASAWIAEDLSYIHLLCSDGEHTWSAARDDEGALKDTVRARAEAAASFLQEHTSRAGDKIDAIVLGVDDARCLWVSAPSANAQVLTAQVRKRAAEWGENRVGATIQPLARAVRPNSTIARLLQKEKTAPLGTAHVSVLEVFDGPLRLLLDRLDRSRFRPARVLSHWHALAAAWGGASDDAETAEVRAVVSLHPNERRLVWAWARDGRLLAGGGAMLNVSEGDQKEADAAGALGRVALDWLTWSAQLGVAPARVSVVGEGGSALANALKERFKDVETSALGKGDAIADMLRTILEAGDQDADGGEIDPRRRLVGATERSGVTQRRMLRVSAAAVALLGGAAFVMGFRVQATAGDMQTESARLLQEARQTVQEVAPAYANQQDVVRAMESALAAIREENPALEPPPPPRPIYHEVARLLSAVAETEDAEIGVINIDERSPTAQIDTQGFGPGELLQARLDSNADQLRWTWSSVGAAPNVRWRLTGLWRLPE
jgi:hypothetical protein